MKQAKLSPFAIRSVLFANVESILGTVATIRAQDHQVDSLFGGEEAKPQIQLVEPALPLTELEVLLQEKNSLGLYVSGSPLGKYHKLLEWIRSEAGRDDIHLVLIDKVRKIFTRSNTMMLALAITSADGVQYEGIVFPKNAPKISPLVSEKQIFWVKGRIVDGRKRKGEESEEGGFEELPKIAFEDVRPFQEGVVGLFANEEIKLSLNRQKILASLPYSVLLIHPEKLQQFLQGGEVLPDGGPAGVTEIKIPAGTSAELLQRVKAMLLTTPSQGMEAVELYIEKNSEYKKAKGLYYADVKRLLAVVDEGSKKD